MVAMGFMAGCLEAGANASQQAAVDARCFALWSAFVQLEMGWFFWIFGFNTHLLDTTARNMAVHAVRTTAKMDRTIKKAATDFAFCGGFF